MVSMKEIKKTKKNIYISVISIFVLGFLNVFKMRFIIQDLGPHGDAYNGLYQMLAQVLVYLSILEVGIRFPAISSLFEPFIKRDVKNISGILAAVKKSYIQTFWMTLCCGFIAIPFVLIASKNLEIVNVLIIALLFICRLTIPYLWQEIIVIVNVDNNAYWVTMGMNIANIIASFASIITILATHNFLLMVFVETFLVVTITIIAFMVMRKKYAYYYKVNAEPSFPFKSEIKGSRNLRLADALMNNTDIIVVSVILGTVYGSSFSTYNATSTILFIIVSTTIVEAIKSLLGKVYSEHNKSKIFIGLLHDIKYLNYVLISITIPMICIFLKPFTELFFQPQYKQTQFFILIFAFYFYLRMIRTPYHALKISTNRYNDFSKITLINAALNITLSILFTVLFGTVGVLIGSTLSLLLTEFWFDIQKLEIEENLFQKSTIFKELAINACITWSISIIGLYFIQPYFKDLFMVILWSVPMLILITVINLILYMQFYPKFKMVLMKMLLRRNGDA